jgi:PKD repeat protein
MHSLTHSRSHIIGFVVAGCMLAIALVLVPTPARAAQLTDTQIQSIVNLVSPAVISNVQAVLNGQSTQGTANPGVTFTRTLMRGSSGSDVRDLQDFLVNKGLLSSDSVTGYFGSLTEQAVQAFQSQNGIVSSGSPSTTGWGVVGPKTAGVISSLMGGQTSTRSGSDQAGGSSTGGATSLVVSPKTGSDQGGGSSTGGAVSLVVSPKTGAAPLTVGIAASGLNAATTYYITYGDALAGQLLVLNPPPCATGVDCSNSWTANGTHTYTAAGSYTISIIKNYCPPGAYCLVAKQIVASTTVTVTGTSDGSGGGNETFSATPTSGTPPLSVTFTAHHASGGNTYYLSYGDGTSGALAPSCIFVSASCVADAMSTHTYTAAGTYTATLSHSTNCPAGYGCTAALILDGTITITVANSGALNATPISGTAPLTVSFGSTQAGVVDFGDGMSGTLTSTCNTVSMACAGVYSISHTYNAAGTYTATLKRETGQTSLSPVPTYETVGTVTITVGATQNSNLGG